MIVGIEQASSARAAELGLKGACLGDMLSMGLEVPPGFIIPTSACVDFFEGGEKLAKGLFEEIKSGVESIEKKTGRAYGSGPRPLLLSVRSGAASPMPGMMETLLNLGMTPTTVEALAAETGDERFVLDCHRRFVRMFGQVVFGIDKREFHRALQQQLDRAGAFSPDDLDTHQFKKLTESYISVIHKTTRKSIPEDPYKQLQEAVEAVFHSWNSPRSMVFRNLMRIPHSSGTAVVVQAMVYGNIDSDSGVGTAITRDPIIGIKRLYGEYLPRAQGEEILEGGRTPRSISSIKEELPSVYEQLASVSEKLEQTYKNIQEIEFTIERGRLYFLQTRPATCTAQATIKAAVDMVSEGLLTREEALLLVNPDSLVQILHRYIDPNVQIRSLTRGLPASPGAASGVVAFSPEEAVNLKKQHRESILVRPDTKIEDMIGVDASDGLLLTRGGRSSHAAVVARRAGKPCVAGCTEIQIDTENNVFTIGEVKVKQGDVITIDGASGRVFLGTVPMRKTTISEEFRQLMSWADEVKTLGVRANSDTPEDALRAIELGAEGIGLCRTETMLMSSDRLPIIQTLVIADDAAEEKKLLTRLQKVHKDDFLEIFRYLNGKPAVLRLLDPPLHEFIPETEPLIRSICELRSKGANREVINLKESILKKIQTHREVNPMLGLRGCRLGILRPEIFQMQITAILEAACEVSWENIPVKPEILIPLVGHVNELKSVKKNIDMTALRVFEAHKTKIEYKVGVLIEIPRAALTAADIAAHCDFFSFGTNDLTQTTFGLSRDDSEHKFLVSYLDKRILDANPFQTLDVEGVARLIRIAASEGRQTKPDLLLGLCGEHGADPRTVEFCHEIGINYVSCSPYQVPIAILAAAQARIRELSRRNNGA